VRKLASRATLERTGGPVELVARSGLFGRDATRSCNSCRCGRAVDSPQRFRSSSEARAPGSASSTAASASERKRAHAFAEAAEHACQVLSIASLVARRSSLKRPSCARAESLSGSGSACRCTTFHSPSSHRKTVVTRSAKGSGAPSPTDAVVSRCLAWLQAFSSEAYELRVSDLAPARCSQPKAP
jgi:hypothetical protein